MTTSGQNWRQLVSTQKNDLAAARQNIIEREQLAADWIERVTSHDLEAGIASCISRASDSLAIPMPKTIVITKAFRSFMEAMPAKDLLVDVALDGDDEGNTYLLVSPSV
ncbi:hypothetical protein [Rhizobium metallidurans]|uniref:Uncharacterized protein n=1 Tax=Rhizobium metallidurans TaxID=1265931 RepID=A0A7W6CU27_9HYPH|nr:hypothetical protein [Rhizobium metallidurans]MBB3967170.1 hypothetical protein [Rhizobium metallidurans]